MGIEENIDTNKNKIMETQEIENFLKNDENVQELWKRLEEDFWLSRFERQKNQKFKDAVDNATLKNTKFQGEIQKKINKGEWWLTNKNVFMIYLQYTIDREYNPSWKKLPFSKKWDIYTRYGWRNLLSYIRRKYKNPKYEFWKWWPNVLPKGTTQPNNPKNPIEAFQKKEPELPKNIDFSLFWEKNTEISVEFSKLETWAKNNFPWEYEKERWASRKRNAEKWNKKNDYIQYDLLIFSVKKYQEVILNKLKPIKKQIYGKEEIFNTQEDLAEKYYKWLEEINNEFPNIEETIKKLSEYNKELEKIQKKYFIKENGKNIQEKEQNARKKYEAYMGEIENKWKELWINKIKEITSKEPNNPKDAQKYFENMEKLREFQSAQETIRQKYGVSVDNYEKYMNKQCWLIKKYGKDNLQKWSETYQNYSKKITDYKNQNKTFDAKKYETYIKKVSEWDINRHLENFRILYNNLDPQSNKFPVPKVKEDYEIAKKEQEETDKRWENLKNKNKFLYQICHIWARWINALISSTLWTGAKLWALISSLWHDDDEMVAVWERTNNWFWNPHFNISTKQSQAVYENGKINFNWDNWPWIIAESLVNMVTLIAGWWALAKWTIKWASKIWINVGTRWTNIAWKVWLFKSWFLQEVWRSFEEWFNAWMRWNQAMLYCLVNAWIQWWLELVSPNEFLLWSWKNLAKSYIKEILKWESKKSLKSLWKMFLKNVWSEVLEENFQEALQLSTWNLINMRANDQFDLWQIKGDGTEKLDADWNPKNFAATALVTTLTTWIVAWHWFAKESRLQNKQDRQQLILQIQLNPKLYSDVLNVLDKAIAWNIKIPNVNIQQLQDLKLELNNKTNNGWSKNNENTWNTDTENTWNTDTENTWSIDTENTWNTDTENTWNTNAWNAWNTDTENTWSTDTENTWSSDTENTWNTDTENIWNIGTWNTWNIDNENTDQENKITNINNTKTRLKNLWIDISRYNEEQLSQITEDHLQTIEYLKKNLGYDFDYFPIPQGLEKLELWGIALKIFKNIPENLLPQLSEFDLNQLKKVAELCESNHNIFIFWLEDLKLYLNNIEILKELQVKLNIDLNNLNSTEIDELMETINKYKTLIENNIEIEINLTNINKIKELNIDEIKELCKAKKECENNNIWLPSTLEFLLCIYKYIDWFIQDSKNIRNFLIEKWMEKVEFSTLNLILSSETTIEDLKIIFQYEENFKDLDHFNKDNFIKLLIWIEQSKIEEGIKTINALKKHINISINDLYWRKRATTITNSDINRIKILQNLWIQININDIKYIKTITNNDIKNLELLKSIKPELDKLWIKELSIAEGLLLLDIISTKNKKDYIKRKNEYLKNNQTLSDEQFNALFKPNSKEYKNQNQENDYWFGKYWISDINQTDLGYCYAYTWFELLKKSNFFDILIKTSMKETDNWREIKLPLWDPNGHIIKVCKEEIWKKYDVPTESWWKRIQIYSTSNSAIWFKILEIAFIKEYILNNNKYDNNPDIQKAKEEFKKTWELTITGNLLHLVEWWHTWDFFKHIINNDIISSQSFLSWRI